MVSSFASGLPKAEFMQFTSVLSVSVVFVLHRLNLIYFYFFKLEKSFSPALEKECILEFLVMPMTQPELSICA